jgi:hypothetical protein
MAFVISTNRLQPWGMTRDCDTARGGRGSMR